MKKFRFRFSAVERVRKIREDEALRAFGLAQRGLAAAESRKVELEQELGAAMKRFERMGNAAAVPASFFAVENSLVVGHRQRLVQQEQAITRARRGVEKALRGYILARRQTRIIERLKERDLEEFKRERTKREQKTIDDQVSMRFGLQERMDGGLA
jgi:flagellar FliJ protein